MFFKRRYPVSDDLRGWIVENIQWAVAHGLLTPETPLVLPTRDFIRAPKGTDATTARAIAEDLKALLGLEGETIGIEPADALDPEYRTDYNALSSVAGTWAPETEGAVIQYDPAIMRQPLAFLSLMTHELMHHVLNRIEEYPPGGPEAEELATDLHMITMGFGVIAMSGAEQAGWQGYMTQPSRAHALAVFLAARGIPPEEALGFLPGRAGGFVKRAIEEVAKSGEIEALPKLFS